MTKALIIDDEEPARALLRIYLKDFPDIEVVGEAQNGFDGAKMIREMHPELIFLDIQMPKLNGFEMLEILDEQPQVIFCTAFDQYAIDAFEKNALDYLLKPFSKERFAKAIEKVNQKEKRSTPQTESLSAIDYQLPLARIVVKDRHEITIIDVEKILFLEAQDDYVAIYTAEGKWLKQQTMKYFETALDSKKFVRIHRKYIVKLDTIAKLDKLGKESYVLVLHSGKTLPVSASGRQRLREVLGI